MNGNGNFSLVIYAVPCVKDAYMKLPSAPTLFSAQLQLTLCLLNVTFSHRFEDHGC